MALNLRAGLSVALSQLIFLAARLGEQQFARRPCPILACPVVEACDREAVVVPFQCAEQNSRCEAIEKQVVDKLDAQTKEENVRDYWVWAAIAGNGVLNLSYYLASCVCQRARWRNGEVMRQERRRAHGRGVLE
jgi:hypothetical protein